MGDGEVRLGTRLLAGQRRKLCRLLRQPETSRLPAVQVHEREAGKRGGAQTVVTDLLGELDSGARMLLCRLHSLAEADVQGELPVQCGAERRRRARLRERLALELDRAADVVALDLGCESERLRPRRPRRGHHEQLLGERAGALDPACHSVSTRGSCDAPGERNAVAGRCMPDRVLAELGRGDRCALGCGSSCCLLELACELGVRSLGREREVTSVGDRIVDEIGERGVRTLPLGCRQPLVEDRSQQRVREPHASTLHLDDLFGERRLESALLDPRATELGDRESPMSRREHESVARRAGEPVESGGHELLQPLGDGQRLRRIGERAVRTQGGAGELEGVERIAPRCLVQPEERGT